MTRLGQLCASVDCAAFGIVTDFHTQSDEHSAHWKLKGSEYGHAIVPFGETVTMRDSRLGKSKLKPSGGWAGVATATKTLWPRLRESW